MIKPTADVIKIVLAIILLIVVFLGVRKILSWREDAEAGEVKARVIDATSSIIKREEVKQEERKEVDIVIAKARTNFQRRIEEDKVNEPAIAERAERLVPDSRLRAFRERRLERERLGCIEAECEQRS